MSDDALDLRFIARSLKSINDRIGSIEDSLTVLTAMVLRMDATLSGNTNELRALLSQQSRMQMRLKALETEAQGGGTSA